MDLAAWISICFNLIISVGLFAAKKLIETNVQKRVEHNFNERLERTKSALRLKESEIQSLLETVLGGAAQRRAFVDKRRIEAVERIWAALSRLEPFAGVTAMMAHTNFDMAAKRAPNEPNIRRMFDMIANPDLASVLKSAQNTAVHEQPFLSALAWAYYSAYASIVQGAYMEARALAEGVEDAGKLLNRGYARDLLKVALPHRAGFIEENDPSSFHFLLDELKDSLLAELKRLLEGHDTDLADVERAKQINESIKTISAKSEEDRAIATIKGTNLQSITG